ncbi:serine-rich adhesin for platelets isoform X2 [Folsomia candida]|uniref:serine-rich adhesin for platelets isoform X2 n=1 Tax=Folsomia candida TaxID=158441 RepID=UPI000B8FB81C|nr:serine-rich adhesin for platelets isoform X2 [Folsomia candida]
MKRRTKGARGGSSRGGGRGRGRGSRGGSRGGGTSSDSARGGGRSTPATATGRGGGGSSGRGPATSYISRGNAQYHAPTNDSSKRNTLYGPSSSSSPHSSSFRTKSVSEGDTNSGLKPSSDFYLHKKFKKLTNTVEDNAAEAAAASNSSSSSSTTLRTRVKPGPEYNGLSTQQSHNHILNSSSGSTNISDNNAKNVSSAMESKVIRQSQSLENSSSTLTSGSQQLQNKISSAASNCTSTMVYKPKFRIASESEISTPHHHHHNQNHQNGLASSPPTSASISSSSSNQGDSDADAGKVCKVLRLDRQSLDDRISKIIDENQSLLEWPEHFTKKLKSHTSRNSTSSQRTNQLTIMSGGSTTELVQSSSKSNPPTPLTHLGQQSSLHPPLHHNQHNHHHHNGLVRHSSFDMTSSGGTVEFLTNPLILKAQADLLKNSFSNGIPESTSPSSLADLVSFPLALAANASSLMVPKKRRRMSPTPSRLCGGEVSELPMSEVSLSKNYYQDVDMNVRVNNCSGAKVTIRTSNGSGSGEWSVQSVAAANFGRFMEQVQVPSSPHLVMDSTSLFFPNHHHNNNNGPLSLSTKGVERERENEESSSSYLMTSNSAQDNSKGYKGASKSPPKRKNSRHSKTISTTVEQQQLLLPPPPPISGPVALDLKLIPNSKPFAVPTMNCKVSSPGFPSAPAPPLPHKAPTCVSPPKRSPQNGSAPVTPPQARASHSSSQNETTSPKEPKHQSSSQTAPLPSSNSNPKRPNFLALKPVNNVLKKFDAGVLPSPETPRVAKSYNQMSINGNAYTYLGFKVSTRSSYCTLFKPQPMFIPQNNDPKLSMYSNWQPCPKDPKEPECDMSTNDSRINGRKDLKTIYTSAIGKNCDTLAVSSPDKQPPISSPMSEKSPLALFSAKLNATGPMVTSLSRSSEAVPHGKGLGLGFPTSLSTSTVTTTSSTPISSSSMSQSQLFSPCKNTTASALCSSSTLNSSVARAISILSSSSDLSSGEENTACNNSFGRKQSTRKKKKKISSSSSKNNSEDGQLLIASRSSNDSMMRGGDDSNSASDSIKSDGMGVMISRADGSRVRIMEGGFESNEAYTYVRGRGKGRFVCEACGIRCKKPSMLRKHLKTHTDLRPYTCKLCNFSFKTKGNLTKHQKSKSHHKKCISMGIHPESVQSLASTGPNISDSNSENDSDDDEDEGDSDSQCDEGDGSPSTGTESECVEKEIALSLLDLSRMSQRPSESEWSKKQKRSSQLASAGEDLLTTSGANLVIKSTAEVNGETPMDLSVKPKSIAHTSTSFEAVPSSEEPEVKRPKLELNGFVKSIGLVSEAQSWEPEEELISKGSLDLKKVLNTSTESSTPLSIKRKPSPTVEAVVREIKQEIFDYPGETGDGRPPNGYVKRKRQDSENSNSSNSQIHPVPSSTATSSSEPQQPGSSAQVLGSVSTAGGSSAVRLHQPWLSPTEKKALETEGSNGKKKDGKLVESIPPEKSSGSSTNIDVNGSASTPDVGDVTSPKGKTFATKPQAEFRQPSGAQAMVKEDGKAECNVCGKSFARPSQLTLHMNIHYLERPFRCDPCGVSFRTKGHLIKHRRSSSHDCKAWGVANEENPRPFKCADCKIAFRIHGHLAKHLRSKMHIMRMECLGKLPFGIYFEMEKSGMNLNEIDTTDCDMSLVSLQTVARKIYGETWMERLTAPVEEPS